MLFNTYAFVLFAIRLYHSGGQNFNTINDVAGYAIRKVHTFYIPFLLFAVPICLLHNVFYDLGVYDTEYNINQYITQILRCLTFSVGTTEPFLPQLWFLKTLFLAEILYSFLHWVCNRMNIKQFYLLLLAIVFLCLLPKENVLHFLEVNIIWPIKAWIFIEVGRLAKGYNNRKWVQYSIMPFVVFWCSLAYEFSFSFQDSYGRFFILQLLLAVLGYFSFYYISKKAKQLAPLRMTACYIGRKSLYVFFWHYVAFAFVSIVYSALFDMSQYEFLRNERFCEAIPWLCYAFLSTGIVLLAGYVYDEAKCFIFKSNR